MAIVHRDNKKSDHMKLYVDYSPIIIYI
jgi:hypothetical protein